MERYYEEILEETRHLASKGMEEQALYVIEKELGMPYVPEDAETCLKQEVGRLRYQIADKKPLRKESMETLLSLLKGTPQQQLHAAYVLSGRNLLHCLDEVREYLADEPLPEASAVLIEALAEQKIYDDFKMVRDGVEYLFCSDEVIPIAESEGYLLAKEYLDEWLGNDYPDMHRMSCDVLLHAAYVFLPLSYGADEALELALMAIETVSHMMDEGQVYNRIKKKLAL